MRHLFQRLRSDDKGVAAIEFAILSPIIIIMIIGVLETGRVLYTRSTLQSGLELAGRYAMVHPDATQSQLQSIAFGSLKVYGNDGAEATLSMASETGTGADFIVLTASITHKMIIPMVDLEPITLNAKTVVPIQQVPTP